MTDRSVAGRLVLIAGATSASGAAVARPLTAAGAAVVAVGTRPDALEALRASVPGVTTRTCDLSDLGAVTALADDVHADAGRVDADQVPVRDGDVVGGAGEIDEYGLGTDRRWLGVEDPVLRSDRG